MIRPSEPRTGAIDSQQGGGDGTPGPTLPLSDAQRDRLAEVRRHPDARHLRHCLTVAVEIRGPLRPDALRAGLLRLVRRRPALSAAIPPSTGDEPPRTFALLPPDRGPVLDVVAVNGRDPGARWDAAYRQARAETHRPFPVGAHPLVRATVLTAEPDRHLLVVAADQLVCDAWSANLLLEDLFDDSAMAEPDAYATLWPHRATWPDSAAGVAATARRRDAVRGATGRWPLGAAAGRPLPRQVDRTSLVEDTLDVDPGTADALRVLQRRTRGSALGITATALALALPTDPDSRLAFRSTLAARENAQEESVVGWFAGEALVVLPARRGSVGDHMREVRAAIFGALADQRVPYPRVRDVLDDPGPDAGPTIGLLYLPAQLSSGQPHSAADGVAVERSAVAVCPTGADLDVYVLDSPPPDASGARVPLRLGAATTRAILEPEALSDLLRRWVRALQVLAAADLDDDVEVLASRAR